MQGTDVDGDALTWTVTRAPKNGALSLDKGTLTFTPAKDWHGTDTVTVAASDGRATTTQTFSITTTPVNDPPVVEPLRLATREDEPTGALLAARDVDGDALRFAIGTPSPKGTATVDGKGRVVFTPARDENGAARFVVVVDDGAAKTEVAVDVAIAAVNDPPAIGTASLKGDEDTVHTAPLTGTDVDGDALTWSVARAPAHGAVAVDKAGVLTFSPAKDWHGSDDLVVAVSDGRATASASVRITTAAVNDAPVVEALRLATREDEPTGAAITARDIDGDPLRFSVGAPPSRGTATVDGKGRVVFTPARDAYGEDRFVVIADDGKARTEASVIVTITPVNDPPMLQAARLETREDERGSVPLSASDVDGDVLTFSVGRAPNHGTADVDATTGRLSFSPAADWHGSDSAIVAVTDGKSTAEATVTLTVTPVNDPPVAQALRLGTREDEATGAPLSARDVDGDALRFSIGTPPSQGNAAVDARGRVTYTPARDKNGSDRFVILVDDGAARAEARVDVSIAPVNDPPTAAPASFSVAEDGTLEDTVHGSDVDGDLLRVSLVAGPAVGGTFSLSASGALRWSPPRDFHGTDKVVFDVDDGQRRARGEASITVTPVNDAPVLRVRAATTREDKETSTQATAHDVDGDALRFRVERAGAKSDATIDLRTGALRIVPRPNENGRDVILIAVDDGTTITTAECVLTIAPEPDPPQVRAETVAAREDTRLEFALPSQDPDGEPLTFALTSAPTRGTAKLVDARRGIVQYTPNKDVFGDDVLGFSVSDGTDDKRHTVTGSVVVAVAAVDDAPVVDPLSLVGDEDTPVRGTAAMRDIEGDQLELIIAAPPKNATVLVEDPRRGTFIVTPAQNAFGTVSFQIAARESASDKLTSGPATVTVTVRPQNDAPVATSIAATTAEDTPLTGSLPARDVDGDVLRWSLVKAPDLGAVTIDEKTGRYTYAPRKNVWGPDGFLFAVSDDGGLRSTARVDITVTPVDDPPVATPVLLRAPTAGRVTDHLLGRDPEGSSVRFRILDQPAIGTVKLLNAATGEFAFSCDGGGGAVTFHFVVEADGQTSAPETVTVHIE